MATINKKTHKYTHEGAVAKQVNNLSMLRRSVLSCMLWENSFYEDGESIANRIANLAHKVTPQELSSLAIEARTQFNLRHVSLYLARLLASHPDSKGSIIGKTISQVICRADELAEFLAIYWEQGKCPLSKQVKKGLAEAFTKFDEYQLAKYNRDNAVKLRDVLFLCHAKPKNKEQGLLWKRLIDGQLKTPDTWEVNLSKGDDKKETFTRLLDENKLGYMALLRNMRNMYESGVPKTLVAQGLMNGKGRDKVLPFRYVAAALACPAWEDIIDDALLKAVESLPKLSGKTILLIDVSSSMTDRISLKSDLARCDAAGALAAIILSICDEVEVILFHRSTIKAPPRKGMALVSIVRDTTIQVRGGTSLGYAVGVAKDEGYDRLIVFTDEQSQDRVPDPSFGKNYMINVASYQNGVGYGAWTHVDGFSESVVSFIKELESS